MKYYVYLLRCADQSLYCGQTSNLARRLNEHQKGTMKSSRYVRSRLPVQLVYFETCNTLRDAMVREIQIKKMSKQQKEMLLLKTDL